MQGFLIHNDPWQLQPQHELYLYKHKVRNLWQLIISAVNSIVLKLKF